MPVCSDFIQFVKTFHVQQKFFLMTDCKKTFQKMLSEIGTTRVVSVPFPKVAGNDKRPSSLPHLVTEIMLAAICKDFMGTRGSSVSSLIEIYHDIIRYQDYMAFRELIKPLNTSALETSPSKIILAPGPSVLKILPPPTDRSFFSDISDEDYIRLRNISCLENTNNLQLFGGIQDLKENKDKYFWQKNYEPTLSCMFQRRMGARGDGGKWVCDPHRIQKNDCLVYSIGSSSDYTFETAVVNTLGYGSNVS